MSVYRSIRMGFKAIGWLFSKDPVKRRRILQEFARYAAMLFGGFYIEDDWKRWRKDKEFFEDYKKFTHIPYPQERKWTLREIARATRNLDGDIAECGCFEGASAFFMAKECPTTPIHLFDSFEGLSDPEVLDNFKGTDKSYWTKGDLTSVEQLTRKNLSKFEHIFYYKGWIPDRFNEIDDKLFKLVHVDVDLYQPTKDSLEFFYPRLVEHGAIVLDDHGFYTCPGAFKAAEEYFSDKPEHIIHLPTGQGIVIKGS